MNKHEQIHKQESQNTAIIVTQNGLAIEKATLERELLPKTKLFATPDYEFRIDFVTVTFPNEREQTDFMTLITQINNELGLKKDFRFGVTEKLKMYANPHRQILFWGPNSGFWLAYLLKYHPSEKLKELSISRIDAKIFLKTKLKKYLKGYYEDLHAAFKDQLQIGENNDEKEKEKEKKDQEGELMFYDNYLLKKKKPGYGITIGNRKKDTYYFRIYSYEQEEKEETSFELEFKKNGTWFKKLFNAFLDNRTLLELKLHYHLCKIFLKQLDKHSQTAITYSNRFNRFFNPLTEFREFVQDLATEVNWFDNLASGTNKERFLAFFKENPDKFPHQDIKQLSALTNYKESDFFMNFSKYLHSFYLLLHHYFQQHSSKFHPTISISSRSVTFYQVAISFRQFKQIFLISDIGKNNPKNQRKLDAKETIAKLVVEMINLKYFHHSKEFNTTIAGVVFPRVSVDWKNKQIPYLFDPIFIDHILNTKTCSISLALYPKYVQFLQNTRKKVHSYYLQEYASLVEFLQSNQTEISFKDLDFPTKKEKRDRFLHDMLQYFQTKCEQRILIDEENKRLVKVGELYLLN